MKLTKSIPIQMKTQTNSPIDSFLLLDRAIREYSVISSYTPSTFLDYE